jgi:outer membrane protein OmpA-like peptidoglycan-associated protein
LGGVTDTNLTVQQFEPVLSPFGGYTVDSARVSANLQFSAGLVTSFSQDPLVFQPDNAPTLSIVEQQLSTDAIVTLGLFDVLEVGLAMPIYLRNEASIGTDDRSGAALGDLRLRPKFVLLDQDESDVGVAVVVSITAPTGDDEAFASTGQIGFRPGVAVSTDMDALEVMLNVGADLKEERTFLDLTVGSKLVYGLALQYQMGEILIGGELFGSTDFGHLFEERHSPLEGLLGVKYRTPYGVNLEFSLGRGINSGYGAPSLRGVAGIRYAEYNKDYDNDGVPNLVDACAKRAEDIDLFEDEDGCPDLDNDGDGVPDVQDECPLDAEDPDGFQDGDGCPDPDNDGDGFVDADDECPDLAGDQNGCPPPDRDGDGILDDADKCPESAEDVDGFEDQDGCPDPDNDGDGIIDSLDKCPDEAEDKDDFRDDDGCPDPDNDRDGVFDADDRCPDEAETINGYKDDDGCPDKGKSKVIITATEIKILDKVFFAPGKAEIKARSENLLGQVALVLRANPEISLIEIQGHTDDVGPDVFNLKLSQSRAESVRQFLVDAGVDGDRLRAKGYGETAPAVKPGNFKRGALHSARAKNRRVQFVIIEQR